MRLRALIPALALLLTWPLLAAEPFTNAAEEEARAQQEAAAAADENVETGEAGEGADTGNEEAPDPETAAAAPQGNGDFVPSIQISEDLSVSFPTDI